MIATRELLKYGPEKQESEKGYTEEQLDELAKTQAADTKPKREISKAGFTFYEITCPTGTRVGLQAGPDAVGVVEPTLQQASVLTNAKEMVAQGKQLSLAEMKQSFEMIKGALTIIYPEGLPEWDPARAAIEDNEELEGSAVFFILLGSNALGIKGCL